MTSKGATQIPYSFAEFFTAVRGYGPYSWQVRLSDQLAATEGAQQPLYVCVPTGSGKTATIEALIWAQAVQAERPPENRTVGARIVWAIDRRILVDEVYEQSKKIGHKLSEALLTSNPEHPVLRWVAQRLQQLKTYGQEEYFRVGSLDPESESSWDAVGQPLVVTRWRGGIDHQRGLHHPMQAEVITSTVGQVGSRLLFRGYGTGPQSAPLAAALLSSNTTICLDEAHLVEPFLTTLESVRGMISQQAQNQSREQGSPTCSSNLAPLRTIVVTATPPITGGHSVQFSLQESEKGELGERYQALKIARLLEPEDQKPKTLQDAAALAVKDHLEMGAERIACVVNRVNDARDLYEALKNQASDADVCLLVGPQRPADRKLLFDSPVVSLAERKSLKGDQPIDESGVEAGSKTATRREVLFSAAKSPVPLIIVATQTLEVGLDIDVDAMVMMSASGTAMVQRLGRLARTGKTSCWGQCDAGRSVAGIATIIRQSESTLYSNSVNEDGQSDEDRGWQWLSDLKEPFDRVSTTTASSIPESATSTEKTAFEQFASSQPVFKTVDVSVCQIDRVCPPPSRRQACAELTPAILQRLVSTSSSPSVNADPDVSVFVSGPENDPALEVGLAWRSDLLPEYRHIGQVANYREALLDQAPVSRDEIISLSISSAKTILAALVGRTSKTSKATSATQVNKATRALEDHDGFQKNPGIQVKEIDDSELRSPFLVNRNQKWLPGAAGLQREVNSVRINELKPGDLVLLPTQIGGCDEYGIAYESLKATDVASDQTIAKNDSSSDHVEVPDLRLRITEGALVQAFSCEQWRAKRILKAAESVAGVYENATSKQAKGNQLSKLVSLLSGHPALVGPRVTELITRSTALELASIFEIVRLGSTASAEDDENADFFGVTEDDDEIFDHFAEVAIDDQDVLMFEGESVATTPRGWVLRTVDRRNRADQIQLDKMPATIEEHCLAVATQATKSCRALDLSSVTRRTVVLAALAHDLGKADSRIQEFFWGGRSGVHSEKIAKSIFGTNNKTVEREARKISGLPARTRHELASADVVVDALANGTLSLDHKLLGTPENWRSLDPNELVDIDLLLHLITSHHGFGRPFPPVPKPEGREATSFSIDTNGICGSARADVSSGWNGGQMVLRFNRLSEVYGDWKLAELESVVRSSDQLVSARGERVSVDESSTAASVRQHANAAGNTENFRWLAPVGSLGQLQFNWLQTKAPYAPVITAGLLSAIQDSGAEAYASWQPTNGSHVFTIHTEMSWEQVAQAVVDAPWPDINKIAWPTSTVVGQAIKPMLEASGRGVELLVELREQARRANNVAEVRWLEAVVTETVLDPMKGLPSRNRLLKGVKSDVSGVADKVKIDYNHILAELREGPKWKPLHSGRGLGFVPEVQTFGGSSGRAPSDVGAHSPLLFRLLWLGILRLPPFAVLEGGRRRLGGPLITNVTDGSRRKSMLSWPIWTYPVDLDGLLQVYCWSEVQAEFPVADRLRGRGIDLIYRTDFVPINSMIDSFRWGALVTMIPEGRRPY